jgi:hypothetical protein
MLLTPLHLRQHQPPGPLIGRAAAAVALCLAPLAAWAQAPFDSTGPAVHTIVDTAVRSAQADAAQAAPEATPATQPSTEPTRAPGPLSTASTHAAPNYFPTEIPSGILFGTFTSTDGPYLISGSIIVPSGQKLEFGPGCRIYIGGEYTTITVFGQLVVRGSAAEPVIFQSASKRPNPWDWDRIYCRSRNRSVFEHCIIRHSNYGIEVENGSATIDHCTFERNSLQGLVVKNSDVSIFATRFQKGHVLALLCQAGSNVVAESLFVQDNITGIACENNSSLKIVTGQITGNTNGIAVYSQASVSLVSVDVTHNQTGIVSTVEIPKKVREMVYGNGLDAVTLPESQMANLVKQPEIVKSVVLPRTATPVGIKESLQPGFSAVEAEHEQSVSFMGNVTAGFRYFYPTSVDDSLRQTRYPGETGTRISGLQPELQIFTSGRRKSADINLLMDVYGNQWIDQPLHMRKNSFNLSANYQEQHVVVGDFFESGSETSVSGRKFTGIRYGGSFLPMGKGDKRISLKLAGGETEIPKDVGRRELDLYSDTVDTGMSLRQQISYVAGVSVKPTLNSAINVMGLISRDQTNTPLFRTQITDPKAPAPIKGQSGHIDGMVDLLDGKLTLNAEVDLGVSDTIDTTDARDMDKVAWYNPQVGEALPAVFGIKRSSGTAGEYWKNHLAASIGAAGKVRGFDLSGRFSEIRPQFFTAGNPYLESDRRIFELAGEKTFHNKLVTSARYQFERRYAANQFNLSTSESSPVDKSTIGLSGEYTHKPTLPAVSAEYTFALERSDQAGSKDVISVDTTDLGNGTIGIDSVSTTVYGRDIARDLDNLWGLEIKQRFESGMEYSLKYRLLWENELTHHTNASENNMDDATQHQISGRFGFRIARIVKNKTNFKLTTKREKRNDLSGLSYKLSDQLDVSIIPRKLTCKLKGEFNNRIDEKDVSDTTSARQTTRTRLYGVEGEIKFAFTPKLSLTGVGRYENSKDGTEGSSDNYNVKIGGLLLTYLF